MENVIEEELEGKLEKISLSGWIKRQRIEVGSWGRESSRERRGERKGEERELAQEKREIWGLI